MNSKKISVVIPCYNAAQTIVAAIQSCLNQTLPPDEIIVVDDGSTDESVALIEARFGTHIRPLKNAINRGPAHARNQGIISAQGHFIAFQDADDEWHPQKLEILQTCLTRHPEIRFLFHPFTVARAVFDRHQSVIEPIKFPFRKLLPGNVIGTPCVLIENHENLRFNEHFRFMEDYELFLREAERTGVYKLDLPLTLLKRPVLSPGGQSSNRWAMRKGEIKALWSLVKHRPSYLTAVTILTFYSLAKHLIKSLKNYQEN